MRHLTIKTLLLLTVLGLNPWTEILAGEWYHDTARRATDYDWELFAPLPDLWADPNPKATEGWFYTQERMKAYMLRPDRADIGNPVDNENDAIAVWLPNSVSHTFTGGVITSQVSGGADGFQFNGITSAYRETGTGSGDRFTFGRVDDDFGWSISYLYDVEATDSAMYGLDDKRLDQLAAAQGTNGIDGQLTDSNGDGVIDASDTPTPALSAVAGTPSIIAVEGLLAVAVNFNDPLGLLNGFRDADGDGVDDPAPNNLTRIAVVFDDMLVSNRSKMDGLDAQLIRRKRRLHSGFDVEGYVGVKYLQLDDYFNVTARGGALGDSIWSNNADNRIVGPSIGFRASRQHRRWIANLSAKFFAGANFMTIHQDGILGDHQSIGDSGTPVAFAGNAFYNRLNDTRFSPSGEFKAQLGLQMTRHFNLHAAWTGMLIGNVARASNTVTYDLPSFGIQNGSEELFAHMLSIGFELNR